MYLLDTNVIIDIIRGKYPALKQHFLNTRPSDIKIPSIVLAELEFGAQNSDDYNKNKLRFSSITNAFSIQTFAEKESVCYGKIRKYLSSIGNLIGPNDMLIAATALANDAIIVTHNIDEFSRVPNLVIEDWTLY